MSYDIMYCVMCNMTNFSTSLDIVLRQNLLVRHFRKEIHFLFIVVLFKFLVKQRSEVVRTLISTIQVKTNQSGQCKDKTVHAQCLKNRAEGDILC